MVGLTLHTNGDAPWTRGLVGLAACALVVLAWDSASNAQTPEAQPAEATEVAAPVTQADLIRLLISDQLPGDVDPQTLFTTDLAAGQGPQLALLKRFLNNPELLEEARATGVVEGAEPVLSV